MTLVAACICGESSVCNGKERHCRNIINLPQNNKTMTKKELIKFIQKEKKELDTKAEKNEYAKGVRDAYVNFDCQLRSLEDDSWIRFADQMPTEGDYYNHWLLIANEHDFVTIREDLVESHRKKYPYWKRIMLPSKPLPSKAEILEKFNISEEQLKEIVK